MTVSDPRAFLKTLFSAAVTAADPVHAMRRLLTERPKGRTIVIGAGKGSAQMAAALESFWDGPLEGLIVTRYGFGMPCKHIEIIEASHPVPDAAGLAAAERLLKRVERLSPDDLVIALISGGGSALLPSPPPGLTLEDEIALNKALLASGAPISAMNTIRKHVSRIKGGRLAAAAAPARVISLIVSDVPGDNPAFVASGPTVPDGSSPADALAAIRRYGIPVAPHLLAHIESEASRAPNPADAAFSRNSVHIVASAALSLEAAAFAARAAGVEAVILSDAIEGEAREQAHMHAAIAREVLMRNRPFTKPVVLLSGGETTVTVKGKGKGGRNSEFQLSLAMDLDGWEGIDALAADTDGVDGSEDNAGAFVDGGTIARMRAAGLVPADYLSNNDAWSAFNVEGGLFVTGPTGTNVNDFRAILIR
ncbi:glycerate kinase [Rhizobium sp. BK251]|uniref:glycerate kinase type-2 family protein n=1 Tax=Rhizobium sp. BK251 TaxID=2512125 RepID=UPI00104533F8|nr:glycerate kinase [Rhizobium sp. BK251]TCL71259.1 glycerate 2-kinase [Rhizobium sp. BK251]